MGESRSVLSPVALISEHSSKGQAMTVWQRTRGVINGKKFGDIRQDAITEYRKSEFARRYQSASLLANSKSLGTPSIIYGAETQLGSGRFTYVLTIQDDHLSIRA